MIVRLLIVSLVALGAAVAHAASVPQSGARDEAVRVAAYHADEVYHVGIVPNEHAEIVFGAGERIVENGVAIGFPEGYALTPAGDALYINALAAEAADGSLRMPMAGDAAWSTTLSVRTDRRRYRFRVALVDVGANGEYPATQSLVFDYPETRARELADAREDARREQALRDAEAAVTARLPDAENRRYSVCCKGTGRDIEPSDVFDAGGRTYFVMPGEIPNFYALDPASGVETPVRSRPAPSAPHVRIVDQTAPFFVIRIGQQVVTVRNDDYSPLIAPAPASGTRMPGIRRVLKEPRR